MACGELEAPVVGKDAADAERVAAAPEPSTTKKTKKKPELDAQDCCCWHADVAGAGLARFSRKKGTCEGHYTMYGCVDSGVCDVGAVPPKPMADLGQIVLTMKSGNTVKVTGSTEHIFTHSKGESTEQILYFPHPVKAVVAQWTQDLSDQGFAVIEGDYPGESHGTIAGFDKGDDSFIADFEGGCQGTSGTCVWMTAGASASGN
jgi:hypothetical protein